MKRGEKNVSEKILGTCCMLIKMRNHRNSGIGSGSNFVMKAIRNVKPLVELKNQQKGFRKKLMKPIAINSNRGYKLAIDWIIQGAQKRTERSMAFRLYFELLNAYQKKGYAIKKKEDLHKECKLTFYSASSKPTKGKV